METLSFVLLADEGQDEFGLEFRKESDDILKYALRNGGSEWNRASVGFNCHEGCFGAYQLDIDFKKKVDAARVLDKLEEMYPKRIRLVE